MPKYQNFEDLPVWQSAARLYLGVLDLLEAPGRSCSYSFRNQLERAALSVSNNIAEGFERSTTRELLQFLAIARGSAGEVRSMLAVLAMRTESGVSEPDLARLRELAMGCSRQLMAWVRSVEDGPVQGVRHLTTRQREQREAAERMQAFRREFLRKLSPTHPLYRSAEAAEARGETTAGEDHQAGAVSPRGTE